MKPVYETQTGVRFYAENDMIIRWMRAENLPFEPETGAWMAAQILKLPSGKRRHFVDVGASTGWYTIPMALNLAKVTAFEPNARVLIRLKENLELNECAEGVAVRQVAVSSKSGTAVFYHNPLVPLTSGGSIEAPTCRGPLREEVETVTLDEEFADIPVGMIKVDVENHELAVLQGAREVIARDKPFLILEGNTDALRLQLAGVVHAMGYDVDFADVRNLVCTPL